MGSEISSEKTKLQCSNVNPTPLHAPFLFKVSTYKLGPFDVKKNLVMEAEKTPYCSCTQGNTSGIFSNIKYRIGVKVKVLVTPVVSDSLRPHGL